MLRVGARKVAARRPGLRGSECDAWDKPYVRRSENSLAFLACLSADYDGIKPT